MKALVLFSGGLDSTVCLAMAVEKYGKENVLALCVSYGQKHRKEVEASEAIAAYYGVERIMLDLTEIFKGSNCTLLDINGSEIPHGAYAEQLKDADDAPVSTYVPFRNGLFLSASASVALSRGCDTVWYGAHADDSTGNAYPDTSVGFNNAISTAIRIGTAEAVTVVAPFITRPKSDVVSEGIRLGVPFELTWSCYEGKEKACGECGTCRDRLAAFAANGLEDPVPYME